MAARGRVLFAELMILGVIIGFMMTGAKSVKMRRESRFFENFPRIESNLLDEDDEEASACFSDGWSDFP